MSTARTALVTGGSGGIGTAICKKLASMGHRVATNYRNEEKALAWQKTMQQAGYNVTVVQHPETSLDDDVKATTRAVNAQEGRSILVGHSYGGMVITQAGNDPRVAGLVYVAAFQPDAGESLKDLADSMAPATKGIKATADGHLYFDPALFHADFAADLPAADARFMALSQVTPAVQAATAPVSPRPLSMAATAALSERPRLSRVLSARTSVGSGTRSPPPLA